MQRALCAALALWPAAFVQAQATSATPSDDEPIVLSPFAVSAEKDVGYLAQNTLAGSRLNTRLKDTGAAISVLTPEFLKDLGATSMQDVILFQNNAVPDFGDAAANFNGNPMIGASEWQLRIRGLAASYARNYFAWEASTDFYNIERIDQARGPNSILFGFGSAGGIVNSSTKQASLSAQKTDEVSFLVGSWDRYRGTADVNRVLVPGKLALRLNLVAENGQTWRQFEFDRSRRAHLALKYQPSKTATLRAEAEVGKVTENVARPWLMIDQSFLWRQAGRPTFSGMWPWPTPDSVDTFWPDHLVLADDGVVRNWLGYANGNNSTVSQTWSHLAMTPENLAIVPRDSNPAGPDAVRETKYGTVSAFYENQVTDRFSFELALNHQKIDFLGYDAEGSRATNYFGGSSELWGDAAADLPGGGVNPHAGDLYLENNWTRRDRTIETTQLRATAAYQFDTGDWGSHRIAGLYEHSWRDFYSREDAEAFLNRPLNADAAEADVNRLYRRHYFTPGDAADIHVGSWRTPVANVGWVPTQYIENTESKQDTVLAALQSRFFSDRLITILGFRYDRMNYSWDPSVRDATTKEWKLDPANSKSTTFNAHTLSVGAVYHLTKSVSVYGNHSSSRDIPNVNIHVIGAEIPPMPKSEGNDAGLKFDFFDGKLYATAGYYTTKVEHTTDWGDIQTAVTDLNTRVLGALVAGGRITAGEQAARTISANGYMEDREADGWEFSLIANPTPNWRISANFSINNLVKQNSMAEVKAWADENTAYWRQKGGNDFLLGGGDWDTIGAQIGWLYQYHIDNVVALDGLQARGERKYGANLYTKYTFSDGALKGFSVGGGGRYQSPNVLGFYNDAVREGTDLLLADASIGYSFKTEFLLRGSWLDLQLNVSNVFDTRKSQIYTLAWWDTSSTIAERIGLQEPRKFTCTATLHF
ncbi:TonB-dependent receptor [Opitutus terrae PB90-1]|uniref:TonB-dependent receptor n=2 Tax=Opitutus terrae TaxID=107709 RepID=B1ZMQ3_OPITP|nr:TonB-dependent receptor [Opitutus terrae PB90-1]